MRVAICIPSLVDLQKQTEQQLITRYDCAADFVLRTV